MQNAIDRSAFAVRFVGADIVNTENQMHFYEAPSPQPPPPPSSRLATEPIRLIAPDRRRRSGGQKRRKTLNGIAAWLPIDLSRSSNIWP